jgi:hypothetical protein
MACREPSPAEQPRASGAGIPELTVHAAAGALAYLARLIANA